jgi:hypothetical protein
MDADVNKRASEMLATLLAARDAQAPVQHTLESPNLGQNWPTGLLANVAPDELGTQSLPALCSVDSDAHRRGIL